MPVLVAPNERTFTRVEQGKYRAQVTSVQAEDFTKKPDRFGKTGHWSLTFHWELTEFTGEDGDPIELLQTVRFETGDHLLKQGMRQGRMPWLTEINRALGFSDIKAGEPINTDRWVGRQADLSITLDRTPEGERNRINAVDAIESSAAARPRPRAVQQVPPTPPAEDDGDIPF